MPSNDTENLLIAVLGPTASGKSSLAIGLALRLDGEIINCDAMQLVSRMDIGTAKPDKSERDLVPHHLFDRIEPDEFYSAGRYMTDSRRLIREIVARGRVPIVVGGTGLYLRALLEGVFEGPGRSDTIRKRLRKIGDRRGPEYLHCLLRRRDPETAERVPAADQIRVMRSLEVYYLSGTPISRWKPQRQPLSGFHPVKLGIRLSREVLYARINRRVARMFHGGLLDEVRRLTRDGYGPDTKGFEAIGYRSALACLRGQIGLEEAIEETARDTRRYAKRQMTWFRREPDVHWIQHPGEDPEALQEALRIVGSLSPGSMSGVRRET